MTFLGLFLVSMPMVMKRAVEVRMYTWAFLWLMLACGQMYKILTGENVKKNWILFTVFSLAAAYTHYFAVLTLVIIYAGAGGYFLFTKAFDKFRSWLWCCAVIIVGYLPWTPIVLRQTGSETTSWIPGQTNVLDVLRSMFATNIARSDIFFLLVLALFWLYGLVLFFKKRTPEIFWSLLCMSCVWAIWVFGLAFELISRPILTRKYLMIPLCVTILGMSYLCKYINKYVVLALCILLIIVGIDVYKTVWQEEYGTKVEDTLQFAREHFEPGDIIAFDAGSLSSVVPYYFPESRQIEDIYSDEYEELWYLDVEQSLDFDKLKENQISYQEYGDYGFDVEFKIYYLFRE